MIGIIKRITFNTLKRYNNSFWREKESIKILVQVNSYFNASLWEKSSFKVIQNKTRSIEIKYVSSKISFNKLFDDSDICFTFGLNNFLELKIGKKKLIYFPTAGLEFLNNKVLPKNYVIVNPEGLASFAIAEYVLSMAMILSRNFNEAFTNQAHKRWKQENIISSQYIPLQHRIVGVVGVGRNGKEIVKLFKKNNCKIYGCDAKFDKQIDIDKWYHVDSLEQMIKDVNILIICVPLNQITKGLINIEKLKLLGKDGYLIDVSRGQIVIQKDLIEALTKEHIAGAAIDVSETEPISINSKLWKTKNLIITPHIAGNINLFREEIMNDFYINSLNFIKENV